MRAGRVGDRLNTQAWRTGGPEAEEGRDGALGEVVEHEQRTG
ncbi:hypothetical protein AB0I60_17545 [Actinosynnema sp. NPDC050436]